MLSLSQNVQKRENMTKVLLLVLFGLFICNDCSSDGIEKIKKLGRYCTDEYRGEPGWQCNDNGMCLRLEWVCDGFNQCDEGDEDEKEGCNLFPDSNCKSWNGQRHVRCHQDNSICTLPTYSNSDCRRCEKSDKWRCNDGQCPFGGQKCKDGSDENSNNDTDDDSDNDESSTKKPDTNEEFLKSVFTRKFTKQRLKLTQQSNFRVHFQVVDLVIDGHGYVFFRCICFISSENHLAKSKWFSVLPASQIYTFSFLDQFVSLP